MRKYLTLSLRQRWPLYTVIISVLVLLAVGYLGAVKITETRDLIVQSSLDDHWRYDYDILVLPKDGHTYSEQKEDYLPPNSSIMNYGGIGLDDLDAIKSIEGVGIAAPIANIGYVFYDNLQLTFTPDKEVVYKISTQYREFNGLIWDKENTREAWAFYETPVGSDGPMEYSLDNYSERSNFLSANLNGSVKFFDDVGFIGGMYGQIVNMIAVDFDEETKLYEFNNVKMGTGDKVATKEILKTENFQPSTSPILLEEVTQIPVFLLNETHDETSFNVKIEQYDVSQDVNVLKNNHATLYSYLETEVPKKTIVDWSVNPRDAAYKYEALNLDVQTDEVIRDQRFPITSFEFQTTEPIPYQLVPNMLEPDVPMFELARSAIGLGERERGLHDHISLQVKGSFTPGDIIPKFTDQHKAGDFVEVWNPLRPRILQDGNGKNFTDKWLAPTSQGQSYFPQAPDMVMSIESATALKPKVTKPISSVRVVVDGVEARSFENQQKVQQIADEIRKQTGHHTEILIGSSAAKVHVTFAEAKGGNPKVIEEAWQKIGFSWDIQQTMNRSSLILFIYLAILSFVFIYTIITHSLLKRSSDFAILRSFGWKRKHIIHVLLIEITILAFIPVIPFTIVNRWVGITFGYQSLFLFLILLVILFISYFAGSHRAISLSPRKALMGEAKDGKLARFVKIRSTISFSFNQMLRRPVRFLLLSVVIAMTSFMLLVIISTQQSLQNELSISFVGEALALDLGSIQGLYVGLGVLLTSAIIFLLIYLNMSERQMEFYTLKALGWTISRVRTYLFIEAIGIAVIGTVLGIVAAIILLAQAASIHMVWWIVTLIILWPVTQQILFTLLIVHFIHHKGVAKIHAA